MILTAALLVGVAASCCRSEDFCYSEPHCDPYAWGDTFPSCHPLLEDHHSPINLDDRMTQHELLGALRLEGFNATQAGHWTLQNNGHSVVLQVGGGMAVSGGGLPAVYHTIQLHFHWGGPESNGSEHTVDGRRYPMEVQMHIVNVKATHPNISAALSDPTGFAVLGVLIDVVYADNFHFGHISQKLSSVAHKGQTAKVKPFPLLSLLPERNMSQYYRYHGSLTTPPCSQTVLWTLYEVPICISWRQLKRFSTEVFATEEGAEEETPLHNNFRHVHPTFSRAVFASKDAKVITGGAGRPFRSALALRLLHVLFLGSFACGL